jgi:hypothetical protein
MYIYYVVTQNFMRNRYSLCPMKKDKNMHHEKAYFGINFFHFST